jgi:hypothetical protein
MSTLALDLHVDIGMTALGCGPDARGGPTLDDLLVGAWEGLLADHTATCPICGGAMTPRYGSGPRPVGGRCAACGSTLQ